MLKNMQEVLEEGFHVLNRVYYNGELPMPVITIMSSARVYGHFSVNKIWRAGEERLNEVNISAEHLDRPIENIMATLAHEMIHYYCQLRNISDTSQGGRYHNKRFKEEAEKRGLLISYAKYIGYSVTEPGEDFIKVLNENRIEKPMDINRDGGYMGTGNGSGSNGTGDGKNGGTGTAVKKTSTRKYICPGCGNSFRATKDIRVMCMDCGKEFIRAEKMNGS